MNLHRCHQSTRVNWNFTGYSCWWGLIWRESNGIKEPQQSLLPRFPPAWAFVRVIWPFPARKVRHQWKDWFTVDVLVFIKTLSGLWPGKKLSSDKGKLIRLSCQACCSANNLHFAWRFVSLRCFAALLFSIRKTARSDVELCGGKATVWSFGSSRPLAKNRNLHERACRHVERFNYRCLYGQDRQVWVTVRTFWQEVLSTQILSLYCIRCQLYHRSTFRIINIEQET